jgi:hypothetical protein
MQSTAHQENFRSLIKWVAQGSIFDVSNTNYTMKLDEIKNRF